MSPERLETRIQELLDGTLADEERALLHHELANSGEARRLYCRHARLHVALHYRSRRIISQQQPGVSNLVETILECRRRRAVRSALVATAAIIVVGLVSLWFLHVPERPAEVVFRTAPGTLCSVTHRADAKTGSEGELRKGSRLTVSQGAVELVFASGVRSVMIAPANAVLRDEAHLLMNQGEAWFQVPDKARGFRVDTSDMEIVDLGTEFGVRAGTVPDEVHVIHGKVRMTGRRETKNSEILSTGEARRIDFPGRIVEIACERSGFLTRLPHERVRFEGALDLETGSRFLGKGGIGYSVSDAGQVEPNFGGVVGSLVISNGGELSLEFSEAVDLRLTPIGITANGTDLWNSSDDFGQFTCAPDADVALHDPGSEIRIERRSGNLHRWEFLAGNEEDRRLPENQSWAINVENTDRFSISKDENSKLRAAFLFEVSSPSSRIRVPEESRPPSPESGDGR